MGPVSRNKGPDTHSLSLWDVLEDPPTTEGGVVEFPTDFQSNKFDSYPVWTENKSKLIELYVYHFIMVTKHGAYIDGFAGPQVEQYNDGSWSAKRVLEIRPPWIRKFILCDKSKEQVGRLEQLKVERLAAGDKRSISLYCGDFNKVVDKVLADGGIKEKEATFCLLDQRTFECKWATVQKLAAHKTGSKIEQFYFVAVGWLARSMKATKERKRLIDWWGRDDVDALQGARGTDIATMFVQRFKNELGYKSALAWPIHDRGHEGRVMYYMIHATDHPEAPKLMNRAYWKSTHAAEPMEHLQQVLDGFQLGGDDGQPDL
jgi:three-Cys-motif partner protein